MVVRHIIYLLQYIKVCTGHKVKSFLHLYGPRPKNCNQRLVLGFKSEYKLCRYTKMTTLLRSLKFFCEYNFAVGVHNNAKTMYPAQNDRDILYNINTALNSDSNAL